MTERAIHFVGHSAAIRFKQRRAECEIRIWSPSAMWPKGRYTRVGTPTRASALTENTWWSTPKTATSAITERDLLRYLVANTSWGWRTTGAFGNPLPLRAPSMNSLLNLRISLALPLCPGNSGPQALTPNFRNGLLRGTCRRTPRCGSATPSACSHYTAFGGLIQRR